MTTLKPGIPKNLFCRINSDEQAKIVNKLNEAEGLNKDERVKLMTNIDIYNYTYCYIGFCNGFWQTISFWQTIRIRQIGKYTTEVTFKQLKQCYDRI